MGLRKKQAVFAGMVGKLLCKAEDLGTPVFVNEWYRSQEVQDVMYARGASKVRYSKHTSGLAVDILFLEDVEDDYKVNFPPEKYKELGEYWESIGGRWGGRFGDNLMTEEIEGWDAPHFEYNK